MTHATKMGLNSLATVLATKKYSLNGHFPEKNVFSIKKSTNSLATTLATKYFTQKSFPLGQKAHESFSCFSISF